MKTVSRSTAGRRLPGMGNEGSVAPRCEEVLNRLRSLQNPANVAGMARFGIKPDHALGISMPAIRKMGKDLGRNHALALSLWSSGIHEARILAALVADPARVTPRLMEQWVKDLDSWDVCDQVCMNLFDKTPFAFQKALAWSRRRPEFVKRAGFALMASLAFHDKTSGDDEFRLFLDAIARESTDGRNFVKKAVNWALRQIGKRSTGLNRKAVSTAREIAKMDSPAARWTAGDALRELTSNEVRVRLSRSVRRAGRGRA